MMRKLRWAMGGGFWDLDMSTHVLIDGLAKAVPDDPLPVSLSRGARLSRPKQIDFMQSFLIAPFVPCFSASNGLALQRVLTVPLGENIWDNFGAVDLASVASDSGSSYHVSLQHNSESPKPFDDDQGAEIPATLKPGLCAKSVYSCKKNFELWKSQMPKLRMIQPYDIFMSNPHGTASGILGAVLTAALGENYQRSQVNHTVISTTNLAKSMISVDAFGTASLTAQYGNLQRRFFDLTKVRARLDIHSGSKFLSAASRVVQDLYSSQPPNMEAIQAMCPTAMVSFQQQIAGPFNFRVDSGIASDVNNGDWKMQVHQPVFAIEHSLYVLGSAKGVFWYSPKKKEFMVELRFYKP